MRTETRNELLRLLSYVKADKDDKNNQLELLLERFEIELKERLENVEREKQQILDDLETLEYVKNNINN